MHHRWFFRLSWRAAAARTEPSSTPTVDPSRRGRRFVSLTILVILGLSALPAATRARAACAAPSDCACGVPAEGEPCTVGAAGDIVSYGDCWDVCREAIVCASGTCLRRGPSPCPIDCNADLATTIDEISVGIAMVLGGRSATPTCPGAAGWWGSYDVTTLVRGVDAALRGCVATLGRSGAEIFDATVDGGLRTFAVATFSEFGPASRRFGVVLGPNTSFDLTLPVAGDAGEILEGTYWQTDFGIGISGTFTRESTEKYELVTVEVADGDDRIRRRVVMTRPREPRPQRFAGAYRIELSRDPGESGGTLSGTSELRIDANGAGLLSEALLHDENGVQRGRLGSARCDVGHDGGVACRGDYFIEGVGEADRPQLGVSDQFRMTGRFMDDGVSVGAYLIGVDPPWRLYTRGTWTAERLSR